MAVKDLLSNMRINRIVRNLQDELELAKPLTYLNRVALRNVLDNSEILATYSSKIYGADIIMNDAEARVVEAGQATVSAKRNVGANIKIGRSLTQDQIEKMDFYARAFRGIGGDQELRRQVEQQEVVMARELVQGVRNTMNQLCAAMYLDGVTYDRFGLTINTGFGTPANLKVTKLTTQRWMQANLATMDAITDLQQLMLVAQINYGKTFNRVDMSTSMFQLIIQSTAFKNQIRTFRGLEPTDPVDISIYNIEQARNLFTLISGLQLVLEDTNIFFKHEDGTDSSQRILPENKVILSSTDDDNNDQSADFAQGIPQELIVSRLLGNPVVNTNQSGILSYYAPTTLNMNPPGYSCWAVVKGFPRKHNIYMNAVLTVF